MLGQTKPCGMHSIISINIYWFHIPLFVLLSLAEHLQSARGLVSLILVRIPPVVTTEISPSTAEEPSSSVHWAERSRGVHKVEAALVLVVVVRILSPTSSKLRRILVHVTPVLVRVARPIGNLQKIRDKLNRLKKGSFSPGYHMKFEYQRCGGHKLVLDLNKIDVSHNGVPT